jgi:phosphoketolase
VSTQGWPSFHLVSDVIDRVSGLGSSAAYAKQYLRDKLLEHEAYIDKHDQDMPEIWNGSGATPNDCAKADRKRENTGGG